MVREGYLAVGVGASFLMGALDARAQSTATFPADPPPAVSSTPAPAPAPPPTTQPAAPPGEAPPPPAGATTAEQASEPAPLASPPPPPPAAAPVATSPSEVPPPSEPPPPPEKPPEPVRYVSATFSPVHLLLPVFEAELEVMPVPHFGISVIGGIGKITVRSADPAVDGAEFAAYELGAHLVGYPLKDFSSLQLGAEIMWLKVSVENVNGSDVSGTGAGVAFGPFVGYKFIADIGFTLSVQGGFQYIKVAAEAHDSEGNGVEGDQDGFGPLLNFNLGWSF